MKQKRATWSMTQVWLGLTIILALVLGACGTAATTPTPAPKTGAATTPAAATPATKAGTTPAAGAATTPVAGTPAAKAGTTPAAGTPAAGTPAAKAGTTPAAGTPAAKAGTTPAAGTPAAAAKPGATSAAAGMRITGPMQGEAQNLTGAGATFPAALYSRWFTEYQRVTNVQVNYQSVGSGAGIRAISERTVDFGATDGPMTDQQLAAVQGGNVLHIPMALGAVVPTYNVPEAANQPLRFTGDTLAGIYLGQITRWNDERLVADNPQLANVDRDIVVVHRSDGSGTTYIWVDYLANVSEQWRNQVGVATAVNWPTGLGGRGNEGVAGEVRQSPYTIGYVELIYAVQNNLGVGHVRNQAGNFIEPSLRSVTAAAEGVAETIAPDLRASIVNPEGAQAYPIAGFTWILAYENAADQAKALALTRMLWWAVTDGQQYAADLSYAPLPEAIVGKAKVMIERINVNGQRALPTN